MKFKGQKGITLIALVVTIVVLLILAGVSINAVFSDNGIIKRANSAQEKIDRAKQGDISGIDDLNKVINEYAGALSNLKAYTEVDKNDDGTVKANSKYKDSEKNIAVIPTGYKVSDVETEKTISKGLVIKDASNNEFVWIPVSNVGEYKRTAWNNETLKDIVETDEEKENSYYQGIKNSGSLIEDDGQILGQSDVKIQKAMIVMDILSSFDDDTSIEKYGGFYMGRYEASYNSTTGKVETQKGKTPYTNIDISKIKYGVPQQELLEQENQSSTSTNYFQGNAKITKLAIHRPGDSSSSETGDSLGSGTDNSTDTGKTSTVDLRKYCDRCFKQTMGCYDKMAKQNESRWSI